MSETKEAILHTALRLFARDGYEAVSVSQIAGALGMTKGALYKHYQNKRDIFESILARMEELDARHAQRFDLPQGLPSDMEEAYRKATMNQLRAFALDQFAYWTAEEFPANFRRMLTLEQYRSAEMRGLYQQYLAAGPLGYVSELFAAWGVKNAREKAIAFYGPMFLLYSIYDGTDEKSTVNAMLEEVIDRFTIKGNEEIQ